MSGNAVTNNQLETCLIRIANYFTNVSKTFTGASSSTAGAKGMVPAPSTGDAWKFLRGDGVWAMPEGSGGGGSGQVYNFFELDSNGGLMPSESPIYSDSFELDANGAIMPK